MELRKIVMAVGPPALAAAVGSASARDAGEVYCQLDKPSWAPPTAAFGPVWSTLYAMIGAAGWRLVRRDARRALWLHGVQLLLNAAWSPTFFSARRRREALAVVVALDLAVSAEIVAAARRDKVAAALLAPYLVWSIYATALTTAVSDPAEVD